MITIAVCDDDQVILSNIGDQISKYRPDYSVDVFNSGKSLLNGKKVFDIVFLDIEMPGINGMETAGRLRAKNRNTYIIFFTSHTEYMQEAFKVRAYRYLVKPVGQADLYESISRAENEILRQNKVAATVNTETTLLPVDEIVCVEALGDGAIIHAVGGAVESNRSLKYWAEKLGNERFFKVHRSYLASFGHIESFDQDNLRMAHMKEPVPISRRSQSAFKKAFADFIKKYASYV